MRTSMRVCRRGRGWGDSEESISPTHMPPVSRVELNKREYRNTDLRSRIQPECDLLHSFSEDIRLAGSRVLEIGPGNGQSVAYLLEAGFSVEAIDHDQEVLDILQTNLEAAAIDRTRYYPSERDVATCVLATNAYALIQASHVLHFFSLEDALGVLDKLIDALTTGGLLLIRVHAREPWPATPSGDFKHFFTVSEFARLGQGKTTIISQAIICQLPSRRSALARSKANGTENDTGSIAHFSEGRMCDIELLVRRN